MLLAADNTCVCAPCQNVKQCSLLNTAVPTSRTGAPIGILGMGIGGGCGVGIGLGYGFGYAIGAQYINVAPDFAERKQHKGNPNVVQQLQHQLDRFLHKDNADAKST